MQLVIGGLFILIVLSFFSIKEIVSSRNQNGIEVDSPLYYLLITGFMTLLPVALHPGGSEPVLLVFILFVMLVATAVSYYRLPKITVYETNWHFVVRTVRKVLDVLNYEYEEAMKQKQLTDSHVYQFVLKGKRARIELIWPQKEEGKAIESDIVIRFYGRRKIIDAVYLHTQLIEALRLRRDGQTSAKQSFQKKARVLIAFIIPSVFLLYIIFR